jgi:uracil-DNA glycosylase
MKDNVLNVFRDIIYCSNIEQYYSKKDNNCSDIIRSQKRGQKIMFQIPEPFSGEIDKAKILIIGSNPSIDLEQNELFPTYEWDENSTIEYFYKRYEKNFRNGTHKIMKDGSYRHVPYLSAVKARVSEIFKLINKEFTPGIDYCLTEIVHCKSNNEKGVGKAVVVCNKYLKKIIKLSPASFLMIVGRTAQKSFCEQYKLEKYLNKKVSDPVIIEGKERLMYFIPAPNARGIKKKMNYYLEEKDIKIIKNWILNKF